MNIVLIPGSLTTSKLWQYQEAKLSQNHHIHHIVDIHGSSIIEVATQLSKTLLFPFALIGFSLGGYIALELMKYIPHQITHLVLINSGARALSVKGRVERERSIQLLQQGKFQFLVNLIFKNSIHDLQKYHALLPLLREMALETGESCYLQQLKAMIQKPDHSSILSQIQCPTLLIASENDQVMPKEQSQHMAKCIKNSELIFIEDCGHLAPLEQPDIINQILSTWL